MGAPRRFSAASSFVEVGFVLRCTVGVGPITNDQWRDDLTLGTDLVLVTTACRFLLVRELSVSELWLNRPGGASDRMRACLVAPRRFLTVGEIYIRG